MLQFEDLVVNFFLFKRHVHALGKNLKLFWVLLINVKFLIKNNLTTNRTGYKKGQILPFLAHCTLIWDFFPSACTRLFKIIIFNNKVFKSQRYISVTLNLSPKTPISVEKWKVTSRKEIEPIHFWKYFIKNQLKLMLSKKCVFRSQKGWQIRTLLYWVIM